MEAKKWLAQQDIVRFKEKGTNFLYDVSMVQDDAVIVRLVSEFGPVEMLSWAEFDDRFEESYGPQGTTP